MSRPVRSLLVSTTLATTLSACLVGAGAAAAAEVRLPGGTVTGVPSGLPVVGPRCPWRAPAGAVFVRRVQPLLGYAYDLYTYRGARLVVFC